jgi:mono/diheme cytochrome c family protein
MRTVLIALLLIPLTQGTAAAQAGDPVAGKRLWDAPVTGCRNCHGANGEGGLGPDLAGRKLSVPHFIRAVRKPWGIMPAFVPSQMSDQEMVDFVAYFDGLPAVAEPAAFRNPVPPGAPRGQEVALATVGCAQCHGATLNQLRAGAGAMNGDFEWFKEVVYDHTTTYPVHAKELGTPAARLRMGDYSRTRLPESTLREIYDYAKDLGFRVPVAGQLSAGVPAANGVTYTLNLTNNGLAGKGLTAEDITVALVVPVGATVVSTTGAGYTGVRMDPQVKANVAEWQVSKLAPKDKQALTLTLSAAGTQADNVRGSIRWTKPAVKPGPTDTVNIAPAPLVAATR